MQVLYCTRWDNDGSKSIAIFVEVRYSVLFFTIFKSISPPRLIATPSLLTSFEPYYRCHRLNSPKLIT